MRFPRLVNTTRCLRTVAAGSLIVGLLGGCEVPSFIDPGEMAGLARPSSPREPLVVKVLEEISPEMEQGSRQFATAEPPLPEDLVSEPADYTVGPNDLLQVTVYDLEGPGLQTIKQTRVSGTGNITLPYINDVVRAEGLTELELQQAIADAYQKAGVIEQANVSVSVVEARNRAYSILGAVARPGLYVITDEEFRVLDAITQAGDIQNPFIEEIYIFRRVEDPTRRRGPGAGRGDDAVTQPGQEGGTTRPADDLAPPQSRGRRLQVPQMKKTVLLQEQGAADPLAPDAAADIGPEEDDPAARVGRIDGQEVVVPAEDPAATEPIDDTAMGTEESFEGFDRLPSASNIRVIRISLDELREGNFKHNVAIRPKDQIYVPPGQIGFYYMGGHIARPGPYAFNGQKITLKQAVTGASGLDGLAIPQRTDIIRRIGPHEEMYVRVDLARIFAGKSPDIYLKQDDHVLVGTNFLAPFLAAVRGGFRMTYGFGFLYDRNFAYDQDDQRR